MDSGAGVTSPDVWFTDRGVGPVVVVPQLNVDWSARDLSALTSRLRVVVVAPRGFAPSVRGGPYDGESIVRDVVDVADRLGLDAYGVFGYSMNGVAAALVARQDPRVHAAAIAGFPLTADLSGMGVRARRRHEAARTDAGLWSVIQATYDPDATEAFWQHVADQAPSALAALPCPVHVVWSEADETFRSLADPADVRRDLDRLGVGHDEIAGLGHDEMLDRLDVWLPTVADWLHERLR